MKTQLWGAFSTADGGLVEAHLPDDEDNIDPEDATWTIKYYTPARPIPVFTDSSVQLVEDPEENIENLNRRVDELLAQYNIKEKD